MLNIIGEKKKAHSVYPEKLKGLSPDHKIPHVPLPVYLVIQPPDFPLEGLLEDIPS